jgi:hypothetical protein
MNHGKIRGSIHPGLRNLGEKGSKNGGKPYFDGGDRIFEENFSFGQPNQPVKAEGGGGA